jgi:hypothetical protein
MKERRISLPIGGHSNPKGNSTINTPAESNPRPPALRKKAKSSKRINPANLKKLKTGRRSWWRCK